MREEQNVVEAKPSTTRRRFSKRFKRELVEQTMRADVSMATVALADGLNTNQLARWRREYLLDAGADLTTRRRTARDGGDRVAPRLKHRRGARRGR